MVYDWKIKGLYPVKAQEVGEELERIYAERGKMEAKYIVDESRPEEATLHPCFEWNDPVAAELYREHQARKICCCLVTTCETPEKSPVTVRAVVHAAKSYHPVSVAMKSADMREELLANAIRDMDAFHTKYATLEQLSSVFSEMETAKTLIRNNEKGGI